MTKQENTENIGSLSKPRKRKWLRRFLILGLLVVLCYIFRGTLLPILAGFLVYDDSGTPTRNLLLYGAEGKVSLDRIEQKFKKDSDCRILVLEFPPMRLQRMGIAPDGIEVLKSELRKRHIPTDQLVVIKVTKRTPDAEANALQQWLADHPDETVTLLCDRFSGRKSSHRLWCRLSGDCYSRLSFQAIAHPWYDETNWWKSREGMLAFFNGYLGYTFTLINGGEEEMQEWDPDRFENTLMKFRSDANVDGDGE